LAFFHSPMSNSIAGSGFSAAFSIVSKRSRRETPKRECGRALIRSAHSPIAWLI